VVFSTLYNSVLLDSLRKIAKYFSQSVKPTKVEIDYLRTADLQRYRYIKLLGVLDILHNKEIY